MTTSEGRGLGPWLQDRLFRGLLGALLLLPYSLRVPLCGWVMSRIVAPLAGYRRRVRENLAKILPDLPEAEVRRMERAVTDNVGRTLIEIYSGTEFAERCEQSVPHGPGVAALKEAQAAGRPVILVGGHFGNYDSTRAALIAQGYAMGALYRPMSNPWFNEHYVRAMSRHDTPLFPRGRRGMAEMVKFLRGGGVLGLLIDQWMQTGARLQFFGQDALTALSAAELALKYDALLMPAYGIRKADGLSFDVVIEAPVPHSDAATMTQALNDSLERLVRAHPEQWFWIHRRWKEIPTWWQDPLA